MKVKLAYISCFLTFDSNWCFSHLKSIAENSLPSNLVASNMVMKYSFLGLLIEALHIDICLFSSITLQNIFCSYPLPNFYLVTIVTIHKESSIAQDICRLNDSSPYLDDHMIIYMLSLLCDLFPRKRAPGCKTKIFHCALFHLWTFDRKRLNHYPLSINFRFLLLVDGGFSEYIECIAPMGCYSRLWF